jgi:MFS family permease
MALSFAYVPFFMLFMRSRGITFTEIGIALAWYYFLFLILELPSGAIADRIGRKATLVISGLFKITGLIVSIYSFNITWFLVAESCYAFSRSFSSGADSAFLYESLAYLKNEKLYNKYEGRANAYRGFALTFGSMVGGLMAINSLESVYIFAAIMAAVATVVALFMNETGTRQTGQTVAHYVSHLKLSLKEVGTNKKMMWIIGYSSLIFISLRAATISLQQPLLIHYNFSNGSFGFFDAIVAFTAAIFALLAHPIEKKLGIKGITFAMPFLSLLIFLFVGITASWSLSAALLIFLIIAINWGLYEPVFRDYLNIQIKDTQKRATILSVESLVSRVAFALVSILLGWILDQNFGIEWAFYAIAIITGVGMMVLTALRKVWKIQV